MKDGERKFLNLGKFFSIKQGAPVWKIEKRNKLKPFYDRDKIYTSCKKIIC